MKSNCGNDNEFVAANLNNLGSLYFSLNNFREAEIYYNESLAVFIILLFFIKY